MEEDETELVIFDESKVELVNFSGSDQDVARAAWVSNVGEESKTKDASEIQGLINFLYKKHHLSPFEHGQFRFYIKTPIFVAREFHRHRTFSYNEMSGRYKTMNPHFYVPAERRPVVQDGKIGAYNFVEGDQEQQNVTRGIIEASAHDAWDNYEWLKEKGVANEVARMVLPVNIMTEFYATVNPRNLMQFLDLRTDPQALYEIRDVASKMAMIFAEEMPLTYNAWDRYRFDLVDTHEPV